MNLSERYKKEVVPAMIEKFGYKNQAVVPKLVKAVVNIGLSHGIKDPKFLEIAEATLRRITGAHPARTLAKKSISNFKIRKGMVVGMVVTLRGKRMYDFVEKLVRITFPRIRDFRGLKSNSFDVGGNMTIGFKENIAFPEIRPDEIERLHGLEVTLVTTAKNKTEGLEFLKNMGFPFNEALNEKRAKKKKKEKEKIKVINKTDK
ncbi:50S ribosomal protein L5 [Candidatus Uhrbacteria bacterium]|nr:50S ribosomal protein L5 [Candidatus Uhrbacteria bacterium]